MVRAVFERAGEPKKLVVFDCLHTDLYTREPWVTQSADEAIAWFNRYLHNPPRKPVTPEQTAKRYKQIIRYFYDETQQGQLRHLRRAVRAGFRQLQQRRRAGTARTGSLQAGEHHVSSRRSRISTPPST